MSLRRKLLTQALRWVEQQLSLTGSGADPSVIFAQRELKSPRPTLPYLTLNFTSWDVPVGTAEAQWRDSGLTHLLAAHRQATLQIRGIGRGSDAFLQELQLRLDTFVGDMTITTAGSLGILDVSALAHESIEEQYVLDLLCEYRLANVGTAPTAQQSTITTVSDPVTVTTVIQWTST